MEPNERHHHHHQEHHHHHLTSPYYHPFHHHNPAAPPTTSTNNGNLTQQPQPPSSNDGSSSSVAVYPHSVPSSAVTAPIDPVKRKRGRPRKYDTPAQALAAKKLASSASNSSARERREQAAAAGGVSPPAKSGSKKALSGYSGKTGQSFTPHIVNIAPGEDVAQKIILFAEQIKHELCILSASGAISNASLSHIATGSSVSYQGQYEILSLSGSYIRSEHGGKTGGLSVCFSGSDGLILGGRVGGLLTAAGPVQVIVGTFQLEKKKDGGNDVKGDEASGSGSLLPSPSGTESLNVYHPSMESSGRNLNNEHHTMTSSALGGGAHFMMQPPQGMHMTHARPSEWGGAGYDLSGLRGNGSSENGDYE